MKLGFNHGNRAAILFALSLSISLVSKMAFPDQGRVEMKPHFHINIDPQRRGTTTQAPSGYSPAQIKKGYAFNSVSQTGAGQTIAIVDAYGSKNIQSDAATFSSYFGLPAPQITIAYPGGVPSTSDAGWALETSLDVEWAHAMAPGAKILLVVAKSSSLTDLLAAVKYASQNAAQVSMSWGASEFSSETSYDSYFTQAGVSYFASSGDSGTGVIWPSASPNVVAVGGTTLTLDSSGNFVSETAWSGSGGGISQYEKEPSFQNTWQSSGHREIPDVSYDANPSTGVAVYDTVAYSGMSGWFEVGGTSAGAPQWAAIAALINESISSPENGGNSGLYSLAGTPSSISSDFREIVSGCNSTKQSTLTCAHAGYNTVTGLGSPDASLLVPAWITAE
ncbi:MAG: S53 family peptidase [Oligoflexia bacterium]|nr:S53 family peptidase [Oligoflexia bacterium]